MWEATVDGRVLHFRLIGINNMNFLMEDLETGSWWQQVSGEAIHGPLKGKKLKLVSYDEISLKIWKKERPGGRILKPDPEILKEEEYAHSDWEDRTGKYPVFVPADPKDHLSGRDVILGIELRGKARAYIFSQIQKQGLILDTMVDTPLVIVAAQDGISVRVFEARIGERKLEFFRKVESESPILVDSETGTEWNFEGNAISGSLKGHTLPKIHAIKDYWFDWKNYHPGTSVFGNPRVQAVP